MPCRKPGRAVPGSPGTVETRRSEDESLQGFERYSRRVTGVDKLCMEEPMQARTVSPCVLNTLGRGALGRQPIKDHLDSGFYPPSRWT